MPPFQLRAASSPLCLRLPRWSDHEKAVGALARDLGFTQVSLSSEVMPMVRAVPRGYTVCADAYLTPKIRQYLKGFTSGFEGGLKVRFARNPPPPFFIVAVTELPISIFHPTASSIPETIRHLSCFSALSPGCRRPVHAVRRRPDAHGAVLWLPGRAVRPSRGRCGLRHYILQPNGEKTCHWL